MEVRRSLLAPAQSVLALFGVTHVFFERRTEARQDTDGVLSITWRNELSQARHARVHLVNCSDHGVAFRSSTEIPVGQVIGIRYENGICRALVRHSREQGAQFIIGVELCETYRVPVAPGSLELS